MKVLVTSCIRIRDENKENILWSYNLTYLSTYYLHPHLQKKINRCCKLAFTGAAEDEHPPLFSYNNRGRLNTGKNAPFPSCHL